MEENKYELTEETIKWNGCTLYRIKALKSFSDVNEGDMGGFVENEDNLSQDGDCWIYYYAKVYDEAFVSEKAIIDGKAQVYGSANVGGKTRVSDNAQVYNDAAVFDNANVCGDTQVFDSAVICDDAIVSDNAKVFGNAKIYGKANVCGNAEICGDAQVYSVFDYMVFKNSWIRGRWFTWTRSNDMWKEGLFYGTGKELIEKAYLDGEKSKKNYELTVEYVKKLNLV